MSEAGSEWVSHTTEQGMAYYYNTRTGETTWECPAGAATPQQSSIAAEKWGTEDSSAGDAAPPSQPEETIGGWEAVWAEEHQMYYYCNRVTGAAQWEVPAPTQDSPREPPPPYSEVEALPGRQGQCDVGSSTDMGAGDTPNSPLPYHQHLQPSPMSTALHSSDIAAAAGWQAQQTTAAPQTAVSAVAAVAAAGDGDAAVAPSGAARARKAASARPPMEREDSVLREALSRRKESLRRLEDVRAGARARLASLKAETEARRAAKLAASGRGKGKDGAAKAPPSLSSPRPPAGTSGADAIPPVAGPVAPEPLQGSGGRAVGPTRGHDVLVEGPPGGLLSQDDSDDGVGGRKGSDIVAAGAADGGVLGGGRVEPELPTSKRRQVQRRKEGVQKEKVNEAGAVVEGEVEAEAAKMKKEKGEEAGLVEMPGENNSEPEKGASIAVIPQMPALPAEVQNVEGFKALWKATVKPRPVRVSSGGGEAATAAKKVDAREKLVQASVQEAGVVVGPAQAREEGQGDDDDDLVDDDDDEVEAGWIEVALSGKEAGDEIAAISALVPYEDNGGSNGSAARDAENLPKTLLSIGTVSSPLGYVVDAHGETEAKRDTGSELQQSYPAASGNGGARGVKSDERGSATAAAAAMVGSSQSTEALSPSSAASSPLRAEASSSSLSAVDGALGRVSRLRELLRSIGEANAWARLLSGDGHLGCRRLADLALSSSKAAVLLPRKGYSAAATSGSVPGRLNGACRRLCSASLGCLAMSGRISPGVWADLAHDDDGGDADQDLGGGGYEDGGDSRLTRLLSLALSLAESDEAAAVEATGLNENEYFFGKVAGSTGRSRQEQREEEQDEGGEEEEPELSTMGLAMIYEILAGSCKARVEGLRCWVGMSGLVESLMNLLAQDQEEGIYIGATRCLLAANDPFLRPSLPAVDAAAAKAAAGAAAAAAVAKKALVAETGANLGVDGLGFSYGFASFTSLSAPLVPRSTVVPALLRHPARHEVPGAVLHIFNEEGYPNGDAALAKLCLVFCSDAFEEGREEDLFYVNDMKVLVDVIVRELANLPADDRLRADYNGFLARLLDQSEWATRGDRYREQDIKQATGGQR
eukprot:g6633.t1